MKNRFIEVTEVAFTLGQEAESELKVSFDTLKHGFTNFFQVAFWAVQMTENEFAMPDDHFKHLFLDFTQVSFYDAPEAILGQPRGIK